MTIQVKEAAAPALSPPAFPRRGELSSLLGLAGLASMAALLLWALGGHATSVLVVVAGAGGGAALVYAIPYLARHHDWLIFPLTLIFLLISTYFLSETVRTEFHYAALAVLCILVLPTVWRAGILKRGGFALYMVYFLWAMVTVSYSLAPAYSAARLGAAVALLVALAACALTVDDGDAVLRLLRRFLLGCGIMLAALLAALLLMPHGMIWQTPADSYTANELATMSRLGINLYGIDRFRGIFDGPNDVGQLMLLIVGPALICWRSASVRERWLLAATILSSVALAALADSRSPFIGLTVGSALYTVWRWRLRGLVVCTGLALAALAMVAIFDPDLFAYVSRGDVGTLTGRTDMWAFVVQQIRSRPVLGYGYAVAGAVFESKYFPLWWGPWDLGPHSSLHNGYLEHAIGVGLPATLFWLYIVIRPWIFALRQREDAWNLKAILFLIVVPILINNLSEDLLGDFANSVGLLFGLVWVLAERYRLLELKRRRTACLEAAAALPRAVAALGATPWNTR